MAIVASLQREDVYTLLDKMEKVISKDADCDNQPGIEQSPIGASFCQ